MGTEGSGIQEEGVGSNQEGVGSNSSRIFLLKITLKWLPQSLLPLLVNSSLLSISGTFGQQRLAGTSASEGQETCSLLPCYEIFSGEPLNLSGPQCLHL